MRLQKNEITEKLKQLKSIANSKSDITSPGILIQGNKMIATNLELTLKTTIGAAADASFILPLKAIDYILNLSVEIFEIKVLKNKVSIISDLGKSTFTAPSVENFPALPEIDLDNEVEIDAEIFLEAANRVAFACAITDDRPVYKGVYLNSSEGNLNFVASDGNRIAWNSIKYNENIDVIIPKSIVQRIVALDLKGKMKIFKSKTKLCIVTDEYTIYSPLISGTFMNYQSIVNTDGYISNFLVSRHQLSSALNRSLILDDRKPIIFSTSEDDKENVKIELNAPDSSFEETFEAVDNEIDFTFGMNAKLLLETIKSFKSEEIEVHYRAPKSGLILKEQDSNMVALVLPALIRGKEND